MKKFLGGIAITILVALLTFLFLPCVIKNYGTNITVIFILTLLFVYCTVCMFILEYNQNVSFRKEKLDFLKNIFEQRKNEKSNDEKLGNEILKTVCNTLIEI